MIIATIYEGFANQVYRYCSAYAVSQDLNMPLVLVVQSSEAISDPFQLSEYAIQCSELIITETQLETFYAIENLKKSYHLLEVNEKTFFDMYKEEVSSEYDGFILNGHFQNSAFFSKHLNDIRKMFRFEIPSCFLSEFQNEISDKISVGIHIRRGDFLYYNGPAAGMNYYKAAIVYMEDHFGIGKQDYYIFSDEIEYVKKEFGNNERIHYVENLGHFRESMEEFFALSICNHHILTAASSFSRLADLLSDGGITVYDSLGFQFMLELSDKQILLDKDYIEALAPFYEKLFPTSKNNLSPSQDSISKRWNKIMQEISDEHFDIALGQLRKLGEMVFNNNSELENPVHMQMFNCLYNKGRIYEALLEASHLSEIIVLEDFFDVEKANIIRRISDNTYKFVFIPCRTFNPMWYEEMIHIGALIRRMGFEVTFLFEELTNDMIKYEPFNKKLDSLTYFTKSRGVNTLCRQINLTKELQRFGTLSNYFTSNYSDENVVFIAKRSDTLAAIDKNSISNAISVFWDFSDSHDPGNLKESGDRLIPLNISIDEIVNCHKLADYVISYDQANASEKTIVFNHSSHSSRETINDFDSYDEERVYNALHFVDIINQR